MADPVDPTRSTLTPGDGKVHLEYPQIPLHLSLESLLACSSSSTSSSTSIMSLPDPYRPALEDSWASLADTESSNEDDLRSENTDVGSLLDVHSTDDIQSISDGLHVVEDHATHDEEDVGDASSEDVGPQYSLRGPVPRDLSLDRPPTPISRSLSREAEGVEHSNSPVWTHVARRPLSEPEVQNLLRLRPAENATSEFASILRMSILEDGLDLDALGYFKVVLLGRHVEQFRTEIQRKLGDALVARRATSLSSSSTSIARFHLVPNAFGPGSQPDFADLVAIDKQIDFDCYNLVEASKNPHRDSALILRNSQTRSEVTSEWKGDRFLITNPRWAPPDLAVICVHLDGEGNLDKDSHRMLSFTERHGIPKILIRMDRDWHGSYDGAWDANSLHESIESRPQQPHELWAYSKYPVNMAAFLNLDSTLLNKHIAYTVTATNNDRQGNVSGLVSLSHETRETESVYKMQFPSLSASFFKKLFIILWVAGIYFVLDVHLLPLVADLSADANTDSVMTSTTAEAPSTVSVLPLPDSASEGAMLAEWKGGVTLQEIIDVAMVGALPAMAEDTVHFQVGVVGDSQIMVKLPKIALSRKKRSPLSVVLQRKEQTLPLVVHELFDGVYSVQLHPRDAYGDIDVHLTMTQPPVSESLMVTFGDRSMFNIQALKEALHEATGHLQQTISSIASYLRHGQSSVSFSDLAIELRNLTKGLTEGMDETPLRLPPLEWTGSASERIQSLYSNLVRLADEGALRGQRLAGDVAGGISSARSALFSLVECVNKSLSRPVFGTTAIAEKLGTAQGRAQRIVANAAARLRPRNGGGA